MRSNQLSVLHRIRRSPHHIKKRWLVGLTILAMLLVLTVWLINLPTFLRIAPPETTGSANIQQSFSQ